MKIIADANIKNEEMIYRKVTP